MKIRRMEILAVRVYHLTEKSSVEVLPPDGSPTTKGTNVVRVSRKIGRISLVEAWVEIRRGGGEWAPVNPGKWAEVLRQLGEGPIV